MTEKGVTLRDPHICTVHTSIQMFTATFSHTTTRTLWKDGVDFQPPLQIGQCLNLGTVFIFLKVGAEFLELAYKSLSV